FTREASMAKLFATESAQRVCDAAAELVPASHPGRATVERSQRDVRVTRIYEGTSEIQRHVIAREVMTRA
ncbi:MAG: acyl-CoA dehydrogenase, partial [Deltaproteobacteria bacterium]|nr:acyl-CoA dehydrogenase [Deltaproteobacteria bacterium]